MMLVNGQITETLPVTDRALHYGDGLFETVLVRRGVPLLWQQHLSRLQQSCLRLGIPLDNEALARALSTLLAGRPDGILKIIISRGSGGRGYTPPTNPQTTCILQLHPLPIGNELKAEQGVRLLRCQHPISINPALAGLKHLNRLDQVLASRELQKHDQGHDEGLMCDPDGHVIEGIRSNLFVLTGQGIVTPDLSRAGVAGIMRALLIDLFTSHGIHVVVRQVGQADISQARELFVCNSVFGIWPVVALDWHTAEGAGEGDGAMRESMTFRIGDQTRQAQQWLQEVF